MNPASFDKMMTDNERLQAVVQVLEEDMVRLFEELGAMRALYVASCKLHATLDRARVLLAIQEVMTDLVGCEQFAILERERAASRLLLVAAKGIDPATCAALAADATLLDRAASNEYLASAQGAQNGMLACIPLRAGTNVFGAIAVFGLLEHKGEFDPVDYRLFDLLAMQAGTALYFTRLHMERSG